jgi:hypothetical protein
MPLNIDIICEAKEKVMCQKCTECEDQLFKKNEEIVYLTAEVAELKKQLVEKEEHHNKWN